MVKLYPILPAPFQPLLLELEEKGGLEAIASVAGLLLGFVVILVAAYWAARLTAGKYGGAFRTQRSQSGLVEILGRTPIGQDRFLLVVRTGGKVLLLGATPQSIQTLCELDPDQFPAQPEASETPPRITGFAETLEEIRKKYAGFGGRGDSRKEEENGKD